MHTRHTRKLMRKTEMNNDVLRTIAEQEQILLKDANKMTILQMVEAVLERAKDTQLDPEFFVRHKKLLMTLSNRLGLTPVQVVLLCVYLESETSLSMSEVAEFLDCKNVRIMQYSDDIEELKKRHYLKSVVLGSGSRELQVRKCVMEAFKQNKPFVYEPLTDLTKEKLADEMDNIIADLHEDEISWEDGVEQLMELFNNNQHLKLASMMCVPGKLNNREILIMSYLCSALLIAGKTENNVSFTKTIFSCNNRVAKSERNALANGGHSLFEKGLIENTCTEGIADKSEVCLTKKAKELLLSDYDIDSIIKSNESSDMLDSKNIVEKELFYNDREEKQVGELRDLLEDSKFKEVQNRLKKKGMRSGFCCLFYGTPGTGKSETAMQIARLTGRNVLKVDVDEVKSKWVGESEENIRAVFKSYRSIVEKTDVAPILLFNECDAILGIRKKGAEHAVDKMENAIQNILLEEMENLNGIMICTTNLTDNLDPAFERRFIYKIEFSKPGENAKSKIWHYMLPSLKEDEANVLAKKYGFSGGQIENIARRQNINEILRGEEVTLDRLISMCEQENINTKRKPIGF